MKPINTSTFDFPTLIQNGFVYVDFTGQRDGAAFDAEMRNLSDRATEVT